MGVESERVKRCLLGMRWFSLFFLSAGHKQYPTPSSLSCHKFVNRFSLVIASAVEICELKRERERKRENEKTKFDQKIPSLLLLFSSSWWIFVGGTMSSNAKGSPRVGFN